jgi:hypothetical protein
MGFLKRNNYIIYRIRDIISKKLHNQNIHTPQPPAQAVQFDLEGNR